MRDGCEGGTNNVHISGCEWCRGRGELHAGYDRSRILGLMVAESYGGCI